MIIRLFSVMVLMSASLFASSGESGGTTDIVERTFNFVIFAGIIYYLVADPLKNFLKDRSESIEKEFTKVQERLKETQQAKEQAELNLAKAKDTAKQIVSDASKEAETIKAKLLKTLEQDLQTLEKTQNGRIQFEQNRIKREVVEEVINEVLSKDSIGLDQKSLTKAVLKKVS